MTFSLCESLKLVKPSLGPGHTGLRISLPGTPLHTAYWLFMVVPSEKIVSPLGV